MKKWANIPPALPVRSPVIRAERQTDEEADRVFVNGVIYTVDDQLTVAQALAVKDGKIAYVGTNEGARARVGEAASVVDLDGKLVLPGLIDGHIHTVSMAFFDFNLAAIQSLDEMMAAIKGYVGAHPEKASFYGFGYMTAFFSEGEEAERGPRKERLDEICCDRPIQIVAFDGHTIWANSKALEQYGITRETQSPRGGAIEKDPASGDVWGTLKDAASALMGDPHHDLKQVKHALKAYQAMLNGMGYTGIVTVPGYGTARVPFDGYAALEAAGELTIRVAGAMPVMSWRADEDVAALVEALPKYQTDRVRLTSAKFFMDGVLDGRSAYLLRPYADNPANRGVPAWLPGDLDRAVAKVNAAGVQCHFHAIGDAGVRMGLDALEHAGASVAKGDCRNAMTHLQLVDPEDVHRFKALDVIAILNPYWMEKQANYWEPVEHAALGERAERMYPFKAFVDEGVRTVTASDYPVTAVPNAFEAIRLGITRTYVEYGEDGAVKELPCAKDELTLWPEERVDVKTMIESLTKNASYLAFNEDRVGTLEVGKEADLIVLDQNILAIDPVQIQNTQVLQTYVGGRLVFER